MYTRYCSSCKTKCKLYKMFIRNPTSVNKQNFVSFGNKLNQTIINAKQTHYCDLFTKSNIKKTWSYINSIIIGDKIKHFPSKIRIDDNLMTNSRNICKCFHSYLYIEHIRRLARMSVLETEVDGSNPGSSILFP